MELGDTTTVMETSSGEAVAAHGGGEVIMMDANSGEEENNNHNNKGKLEEGGGEEEEGDNKINSNNNSLCGGNRWPRQETLALLKIRSDMDAVFRDSSLKGPLWEEVARYTHIYTHKFTIHVCLFSGFCVDVSASPPPLSMLLFFSLCLASFFDIMHEDL